MVTTQRRLPWLWMIPILLGMFALTVMYINADPLWGDERNTVQSTGGVFTPDLFDLPQVWQDVAQNHPEQIPEYQTLANLWMRVTGVEPAAIRILSLLIGCLGLCVVYRLGSYVGQATRVGLYAALIFAPSILIVHYLTRVRTYSLLVTAAAWVLLLYLRVLNDRREPSRWLWVGLLLGVTVLLYTHYLVLLLLAAIAIHHLLALRRPGPGGLRRWVQIAVVMTFGGLLFLPWVPALINGLGVEARTYDDVGLNGPQSLALMADFFGNGLPWLSVLALVAVIFTRGRPRLRQLQIISAFAGLILLVFFIISHRLHATRPAYLIHLWPPLVVLVAAAVASLERYRGARRLAGVAVLAAFVIGGVYGNVARDATWKMENFRTIFPIHVVDLLMKQNDLVGERVVVALPDALNSSEDKMSRIAIEDARIDLDVTSYRTVRSADPAGYQSARAELDDRERVWLAYAPGQPSSAATGFAETLTGTYAQCPRSLALSRARVDQYTRSPVCCVDDANPAAMARFGEDIALINVGLPAEPVHDSAEVLLSWVLGAATPPDTYSITLQVFDSSGEKVQQSDKGLEDGSRPCQPITLKLDSLKAGVYGVRLALYNWHDSARLPGALGAAAPTTELLPIGEVTVS